MSNNSTPSKGIARQTVYNVADLAPVNDGSIVSRTLSSAKSGSLTLFAFAEGQELSEHTCPCDAIAFVLDGTARIAVDGMSFTVSEGQMLLLPANVPHAVRAQRSLKMLLTLYRTDSGE
jgi:quercetin dioxygenase-like cupin family protein